MLRNIESGRIRKGSSKEMLANSLGISMRTCYNWINEDTDIPGSALIKMASLLGMVLDYRFISFV